MTDDADRTLDPDEVECPKCHVPAGSVCRQPNGDRSRTIHLARRRLAAGEAAPPAPTPQRSTKRKPKGASTFDSSSASAAAKKSAQARARRKSEAAAAVEAAREKAEREAIEQNAAKLADDAVRFQADRAIVKRQTLDVARRTGDRLLDALENLHRPRGFDRMGKPETETIETFTVKDGKRFPVFDGDGNRVTEERIDLIGYYSVQQIESLAKAHASAMNVLRLEEGKATTIEGHDGSTDPSSVLGVTGTAELVAWAAANLPGEGKS